MKEAIPWLAASSIATASAQPGRVVEAPVTAVRLTRGRTFRNSPLLDAEIHLLRIPCQFGLSENAHSES